MLASSFILTISFSSLLWVLFNFIHIGRDLVTTLLLVESWWIFLYFITVIFSLYLNNHSLLILIPLILVLAGLEIVLGFYFLYFM